MTKEISKERFSKNVEKILSDFEELLNENEQLRENVKALAKEEVLRKDGLYESEMQRLKDENEALKEEVAALDQGFEYWEYHHNKLKDGINKFIEKNFQGGPKADREDYSQMVSCKDIYNLRELIKK